MVLDGGDGAQLPPINGIRQLIAGVKPVPIAELGNPVGSSTAEAQIGGSVLIVGEISEAIEAEDEGVVTGVVFVNETEIIFEDLVPLVV